MKVTSERVARFTDTDEQLARAYVPGLMLIPARSRIKPDIHIALGESSKPHLVRTARSVTVFDHWQKPWPLDFFHLFYSMARVKFLEKGLFPVHSACIRTSKNILIVGHTGMGKTATLLNLVQKYEAEILAGNKTLIRFPKNGRMEAYAGTTTITARKKDVSRGHQVVSNAKSYLDREAFTLEDGLYHGKDRAIKAIVLVRLNDWGREKEELRPLGALHALYPFFLDVVNADTILLSGRKVFIGSPPNGIPEQLTKKLRAALVHTPVIRLSGSLAYASQEISKL